MSFFKKLFSTHSEFAGDFIETGEELLSLIASNEVVAAEYKEFEGSVAGLADHEVIKEQAQKSADALSGYGISVRVEAFVETVE